MDLIAYRKGEIPTLLGEGLEIAAKKIGKGSEAFAMVTKGIEMGRARRRAAARTANELSYAVASQGGDHMSTAQPRPARSAIFGDSTRHVQFPGAHPRPAGRVAAGDHRLWHHQRRAARRS